MTPTDAVQYIRKWRPDTQFKYSGDWILHSCIIDKVDPHHANGDRNMSAEMNAKSGVYICFSYLDHAISFKHLLRIMHDGGSYEFESHVQLPDDFKQAILDKFEDKQELDINLSIYERCTHPYMLKQRHFSQDVLDAAQVKYDQYSGRIAIPMFHNGRCIAIQRRTIPGVVIGKVHPKYEWTKGFDKSNFVYHVGELDYSKPLLVVESVMSVFRAWDYGFTNCVALFGSHMSAKQADIVRKFKDIMLWLDGDKAGQDGMVRAMHMLSGNDLYMVDATPYGTQDIADLPKATSIQLIAQAKPAIMWALDKQYEEDA